MRSAQVRVGGAPQRPPVPWFIQEGRPHPSKGKKFPPEPLTRDEVDRMIGACNPRSKTGIRNRALIAVLYRGGLRSAELRDLKPKDLDVITGVGRVLHGKGDEDGVFGLDPGTCRLVADWILVRAEIGVGDTSPLFCTVVPNGRGPGHRMHASCIGHLLRSAAQKADVHKRVHAHGFRHTIARELDENLVPLRIIQGVLRHKRPSTTDRYLGRVSGRHVIAAMRDRDPLMPAA